MKPDMHVDLAGIPLQTPVLAASGTFGYGVEFEDILALDRIGGFVTKGLSIAPMPGNPSPRMIETSSGMINAIGLQNVGVDAYVTQKLQGFSRNPPPCAIFANVFGYAIEDYLAVIRVLNTAEGISAYEINASCPNTAHGGMVFGADAIQLSELVKQCKKQSERPIFIKLSPNVTSIAAMAKVAEDAGADGLTLVNTFLSLAIDLRTRKPRIANVTGGLSGPAIKPIAVRMVWEASEAVKIPIIGCGGIRTGEDAAEFLIAGATAVQVGTASYADPRAVEHVANGLEQWCARNQVAAVRSLTGTFESGRTPAPKPGMVSSVPVGAPEELKSEGLKPGELKPKESAKG
ncbi:dihydroorotate dehydrogenase [Acidipila sp. EB88]|uniref:dihydroorotate dehydrogenase n=1 Tax=Acidipila sp. EB88 TaxID=2305226 RepID=UPI000F5FFCB5|nr:dihydroorotate dehydrogenase [Acidipila sp. EB88]RRA48582.1 dihydroorotate dehydrogenase [Acidipila sp. EB88]